MDAALDYLRDYWLVLLLLLSAVGLAVFVGQRSWRRPLLPAALALLGAGNLALSTGPAFWVAAAALAILFGMLLILILTGGWWAPLGYAVAAALLLGLGGLCIPTVSRELVQFYFLLRSLEAVQLGWLGLLALVPAIIYLSFRSLAGLGPVRRWVAIGLRCTLVVLLTLALSEVRASHRGDATAVLFLVDCSFSIPESVHPVVEQFVNTMAESRGSGNIQVGVIYFGAQPRLVRSATDAPRINVKYQDALGNLDRNYTNIAAALKLALASFPEGTSKRIVLITDGNENLGNAEEQARMAKLNGVQVDVVPIGAGRRKENEVLIQSIDAPPEAEEGAPLLIQVTVRSFNPNLVEGTLTVKQRMDSGELVHVDGSPRRHVQLKKGLNSFTFEQRRKPGQEKQGSYTYVAEFVPELLKSADGDEILARGLPGDLKQNNLGSTHVIARRSQNRILILEPRKDDFRFLEENLPTAREGSNKKYEIDRRPVATLPREDLAAFLSGYDCVVLANLPARTLDERQQEVLRSNTYDQGCGLIMVGGPDSFGAGGWQGTKLEEALPVDTDIKSFKVQGKVGLVLIMHATEMPKGNYWQKQIAKLAIKELSPTDEVGILYYNGLGGGTQWHIRLQPIGDDKDVLQSRVDTLSPGDMPDFDPSLKLAYESLTAVQQDFVSKHVILISDGDPAQNDKNLLARMKADKVTVTTVGVATHGAPQDQQMAAIADGTGGRFYNVKNPNALPAIYLKETRLISQDFLYQKRFTPHLPWATGPAESLKAPLPPLLGFVRTTPKPKAVTTPIDTPEINGHRFPILAYWHYGLGKAVAFTSDAAPRTAEKGQQFWANDWSTEGIYGRFWEQMLDWSLRPVESKQLTMTTETRDGKTRVRVVARDKDNRPINNLNLRGGVTTPGGKGEGKVPTQLKFEQKNAGVYEAEFKAEEAGSYLINAEAVRKVKRPRVGPDGKVIEEEVEEGFDSARGGVTFPYSPEFAEVESNPILLDAIREMTDGTTYAEDRLDRLYQSAVIGGRVREEERAERDPESPRGAPSSTTFSEEAASLAKEVFRTGPLAAKSQQPIWFWLLFLTGVLLFFDVAVRRISIEPSKVAAAAHISWERLRGRGAAIVPTPEFFDRLRSRKAQVEESISRARGERRFEGGDQPVQAPPGAAEVPKPPRPPAPRPAAPPQVAPEQEQEPADFGSRLLKAKQRIWQERERGKEKDQDR
jgi:uncharacterized membrane protein